MTLRLQKLGAVADPLAAAIPGMRQDAIRQRAALEHVEHRPWPLPDLPWMLAQTWHDLLFAHWAVEPAGLRPVVPAQLPLDTFDGKAWIGITPFRVTGFRTIGTPPVPIVSSFAELNVRTYVTLGGKPGIYFFSLDADSRLAVAGARRSHRLPYFRARMSVRRTEPGVRYASDRLSTDGPAASFQAIYRPHGNASIAQPETLEHWLSERYCLYTLDERRTVLRADIHHPPWKLAEAEANIPLNTMTAGLGLQLEGPPLLHLSTRQDTLLWALRKA